MEHSTTITYQMKREIVGFGSRLSKETAQEWKRLTNDMLFGILASGSCILSRMADVLRESIKKKNTVERLSRKLLEVQPGQIHNNYLRLIKHSIYADGGIHVDDSDITKPYGKKFEALGLVRDASKPEPTIEKGYHVTEITALTMESRQPVSLYSHIHSWYKATTLRDSHKGKIKTNVMFQGVKHECYASCLKVQITGSRKSLRLILVYGLGETPMMLATNQAIQSRDDVIRVIRMYFSRWRIEEYFRFKKQHFHFEDFRVRSLSAMNALNQFLSYAIAFLALMTQKREGSVLKSCILRRANPQREQVSFVMYRFGLGVLRILACAHTGIRAWLPVKRPKFKQLEFDF